MIVETISKTESANCTTTNAWRSHDVLARPASFIFFNTLIGLNPERIKEGYIPARSPMTIPATITMAASKGFVNGLKTMDLLVK